MSQRRRVIGGNSQDRRRQRRTAARLRNGTPTERDIREIAELVATAVEPSARASLIEKGILAETDGSPEAEIALAAEVLGGKPNPATKPDRRLKGNKGGKNDGDGDESALDAIDAYAAGVQCSCGHSYAEHTGAGGTCGHQDGRGTCSCGEFSYPDAEAVATAYVKVRPDMSGFKAELQTAIVEAFGDLIGFAPVAEMPEAAEVLPEESDEISPPETPAANGGIPWHATFVPEGKLTEDGRAFAPGSVLIPGEDEEARDLPLTLMAMIETSAEGGHDGAQVAGRIDALYRQAPNIEADGVFSNEEWGQMIARMVENKELTGLSVDIAPLDYSWVPRDQFFNETGDFIGVWDPEANDGAGEWAPAPGTETEETEEEPSILDIFFGEDDRVLLINKAVVGMATVCPFPAFGDAEIALTAAGMPYRVILPLQMTMPAEALTAAGIPLCEECREAQIESVEPTSIEPVLTAAAAGHAPVEPPAEWFANPEFTELTPLTITDDGRVYGHAWQWETCHLSFERKCVIAPHSETEYAYFMFGEIACEDGERLNVGRITYDTGHAAIRLSRAEAIRHYDDTGTQAAYVQFGEDEFGGWFAGAIVADMPDTDLQRFRASQISGDWRGIDGNLELVALLAVNVGGFPVPRGAVTAAADMDDAEPVSLVAAGVVTDGRLAHIKAMIGEALVGDLTAEIED